MAYVPSGYDVANLLRSPPVDIEGGRGAQLLEEVDQSQGEEQQRLRSVLRLDRAPASVCGVLKAAVGERAAEIEVLVDRPDVERLTECFTQRRRPGAAGGEQPAEEYGVCQRPASI